MELELVAPNETFASALQDLGCEMALADGRRLKIVLAKGVTVRDIYLAADEHQATIRSLDCKRDSLQDIFLNAMEGDHGGI